MNLAHTALNQDDRTSAIKPRTACGVVSVLSSLFNVAWFCRAAFFFAFDAFCAKYFYYFYFTQKRFVQFAR